MKIKANVYKYYEFKRQLNLCDDYTLLNAWRNYVRDSDRYDDEIFDMNSIDEELESYKATDILRMVKHGDFDICHTFFEFDGYANLHSFNYISDSNYYDITALTEYYTEGNREDASKIFDEESCVMAFVNMYEEMEYPPIDDEELIEYLSSEHFLIDDDWDVVLEDVLENLVKEE